MFKPPTTPPEENNTTPEAVLVTIKNKICTKLGITTIALKELIDVFVATHFGTKRALSHYTRVNMYKDLSGKKLTVKKFFMFLHIIKIAKIEFNIRVITPRGHSHDIFHEIHFISNPLGPKPSDPNAADSMTIDLKDVGREKDE
jgi:hypothetical protein